MTSCTVESKSVCAVVPSPVSFTSRCNFHTLPSSQLSFGLHFNLLGVGEGCCLLIHCLGLSPFSGYVVHLRINDNDFLSCRNASKNKKKSTPGIALWYGFHTALSEENHKVTVAWSWFDLQNHKKTHIEFPSILNHIQAIIMWLSIIYINRYQPYDYRKGSYFIQVNFWDGSCIIISFAILEIELLKHFSSVNSKFCLLCLCQWFCGLFRFLK